MITSEGIGKNIRSLRKAYGETQEELALSINVSKSAVSSYETGDREPTKDTLDNIAKHFGVSVNDLLTWDFEEFPKLNFKMQVYEKNINSVFPLVTSDRAMYNVHFRRAYKKHVEFYDSIRKSEYYMDLIDLAFDEYEEAYQDSSIKEEVAANSLALYTYMFGGLAAIVLLEDNKPAILSHLMEKDRSFKLQVESQENDFKDNRDDLIKILNDDDLQKDFLERIKVLKKSNNWADLGDYYLALYYYYGIVKNDNEHIINTRIGVELLGTLSEIGNPYATNCIDILMKTIW